MLLNVFCVYDSGVQAWLKPMFARSKGEMLRGFIEAVADPQSGFNKYPSDYTLFELGTFDDVKCVFSLHATPVKLGMAIEFMKSPAGGVGGLGENPQERSEATEASSGKVVPIV